MGQKKKTEFNYYILHFIFLFYILLIKEIERHFTHLTRRTIDYGQNA
jgi:hypothetical protein